MSNYSYIIDEECSGKKTTEQVRQIIPILVNWAKRKETYHTYGDLIKLLGYEKGKYSRIGRPLGCIKRVFQRLEKDANLKDIPILNALVANVKYRLPSGGFSYIYSDYDKLDRKLQKIIVENINNEAIKYDKWDYVLALLGLKPVFNQTDEQQIRSSTFGAIGGEGEEHKQMKTFIATHPKAIKLHTKEKGTCEHVLLSGDRLDVFFPLANTVVEVKPKSASDADILRGIFQCVKYKAILKAEAEVKGEDAELTVILVLGGQLSLSNKNIKECLNINVIENFKCE